MDCTKHNSECCKAEVGRGCTFCNCSSEPEATLNEGCFKLHETPWLEEYPDNAPTDIFEVRFKNTRRGFYQNVNALPLKRGDVVAVESSPGHDIGIISLTGDMVAKQMRRTGLNPANAEFKKIYRKAKPYDIEKWQEAIELEHETMIVARQIAADMNLNMKIGDVEYQGDKIKAIFYYIADERVDFRELIKVFAERFHIRIEMKQIGARQEAGRIGGIGACGRELCCASWISSFTSVTTGAARTQDISLNPQKLAGQCSKLKCCLMYEYDTYVDARKEFPRLREPLQTLDGEFFLVKSDVLAGTMTFSSSKDALSNLVTLPADRVKEIISLNRAGKKVERLQLIDTVHEVVEEPTYRSEEDSITRFDQTKRRKNRRGKGREGRDDDRPQANTQGSPDAGRERRNDRGERTRRPEAPQGGNAEAASKAEGAPQGERSEGNRRGGRNRGRGRGEGSENRQSKSGQPGGDSRPSNSERGSQSGPDGENRQGGDRNRRNGQGGRGDNNSSNRERRGERSGDNPGADNREKRNGRNDNRERSGEKTEGRRNGNRGENRERRGENRSSSGEGPKTE